MTIFDNISNTINKFLGLKNEKSSVVQHKNTPEKDLYDSEIIKDILSEIKNLNVSDKNTQKEIENLRSLNLIMQVMMGLIIAAAGIFIPVVFNIHANRVDQAIDRQTKMIDEKIESLKEQNTLLIQLNVANEVKKVNKSK